MTPAQAHHRRRIRTILVFRAAAVACAAFALPVVGDGLTRALTGPRVTTIMTDEAFTWTARVVMLIGTPTLSDIYEWMLRCGRGPVLLAAAAYLWLRSPHKFLRSSRPEARA